VTTPVEVTDVRVIAARAALSAAQDPAALTHAQLAAELASFREHTRKLCGLADDWAATESHDTHALADGDVHLAPDDYLKLCTSCISALGVR
jgi:hypothetical protein